VRPIGDARIGDNTVEALLAAIRETPGDVLSVAVVGHNPSLGEPAGVLDDGRGDPVARRGVESGFPAGVWRCSTSPCPSPPSGRARRR
jgi:phosphohistidine phosphatase